MSGFEWFLLIVMVILVPLVVAVAVTLWTLEQARQRKRQNREVPADGAPVKRRATREATSTDVASVGTDGAGARSQDGPGGDDAASVESTPDAGGSDSGGDAGGGSDS